MDLALSLYFTLCVGSFILAFQRKKNEEIIQSVENLSKGTSLVGVQGSGKTYKAMLDCIALLSRGYKFCWVTTQGERQCKLIDHISIEYRKDIELFAPYRASSKGFNLLKCYTEKENERELRAQSAVILLNNMSDKMSANMEYCIYMATLAVLEYQAITGTSTTLYDAWQFTKFTPFRNHVLSTIHRPDFKEDFGKFTENTLSAVHRRFGFLLSNRMLMNALCYTKEDELDFQEMFNKIFICDFIEDNINGLGTIQAIALAQAIMIQFNILASTRNNDCQYYQITCDEFYRYATGIENIFRDFPDMHRQRRIGLYLIWQRFSQMSKPLVDIALSCVNKYFMQMQVNDDAELCKGEMYKAYKGQFSGLKEREVLAFVNIGSGLKHYKERTKDIGISNNTIYSYVLANCRSRITKTKFKWWYENPEDYEDVVDTKKYEGIFEDD